MSANIEPRKLQIWEAFLLRKNRKEKTLLDMDSLQPLFFFDLPILGKNDKCKILAKINLLLTFLLPAAPTLWDRGGAEPPAAGERETKLSCALDAPFKKWLSQRLSSVFQFFHGQGRGFSTLHYLGYNKIINKSFKETIKNPLQTLLTSPQTSDVNSNKPNKDTGHDKYQFDAEYKAPLKQRKVFVVRPSVLNDIPILVSLSHKKRLNYEKAQSQFWRYAGPAAEISQATWFEELLERDDYLMLTAESDGKIVGFLVGQLMRAPEVYNPGGLTLMIDDFCVEQENLWHPIGTQLIQEIKLHAKTKGAVQLLVVAGHHDAPKLSFLKNIGLTSASEWLVGEIE